MSECGFTGGESTVRRKVRELKGARGKAFVPLSFEPGEAMQVDWGEADIYLSDKKTKVYIFCARLCYSCKPVVVAYWHQNEECFKDAFVTVFTALGGVPRKVIFDNARVAVKKGFGAHAEMQDGYAALSAFYAFDAEFCNPASGHEKGLVEGLVGWARRNILVPVPHIPDLSELNQMLATRCIEYDRHQIVGKPDTVGALFAEEQKSLRPLPVGKFETAKCSNVRVTAYSTARALGNEYSVPCQYVGSQVGVKCYHDRVEIYFDGKLISEHPRAYGKNEKVCKLLHYLPLLEERGRAILNAIPVKENLSEEAFAELKANIGNREKMLEIIRREAGVQYTLPVMEGSDGVENSIKNSPPVMAVDLHQYDLLLDGGEAK